MALQQVIHILRNTGTERTVLSDAFPKCKQEVCRILMLEQKIDFVDDNKGVFALGTVSGNAVQYTVKHYKHTDGQKLFAEIENVIADKAVIDIYIRFLGKGVKRTVGEKLNGKSNFLCFGFVLFEQIRAEVL